MKRPVSFLMFVLLILSVLLPAAQAAQSQQLQLFLDGRKLQPSEPPRIVKQTTMVPARIISEALGAEVGWDRKSRTATITRGQTVLSLTVNQPRALVSGNTVSLEQPPMIAGSTMLLPLRFIAEQLGILVRWDKPTRSINLWSSDIQVSGSDPATEPSVPPIPGGEYPILRAIFYVNNQLVVKTGGPVTPSVTMLSNPDRLVVDIPGLTFGKAFPDADDGAEGTLPDVPATDALVSAVRYSLYDSATSTIRIVADLKQPAAYQVVNSGDRNSLIVHMSAPQSQAAQGSGVLIYHSHNRESFLSLLPGVTDPDKAFDATRNVQLLGERLAQNLRSQGAEVYHTTDDYPSIYGSAFSYGKSYVYSEQTVKREMAAHPQIKYVFDLHRDTSSRASTTVNIGGVSYARLYFVIGLENPDWKKNDAFAKKLQGLIEAKYPGMSRGIYYKDRSAGNGWYNQNLSPTSALIEIGGVYNTLAESNRTIDVLADAINRLRLAGY
ncbi:AMIN domain-containing protein [Cohnella sp. CFH 77786]|uniref:stage II sporulation protein P n=1 Tax=Cohnella sp. CFH 77786 TaxID=2662265 RepID=UPI001C610549|nr:stage II sporulation protein P [Cohnella sp. CFH 77786]MBW5446332.1 AMIN domain-containing protein [Cohnella sp. CFH 77786]